MSLEAWGDEGLDNPGYVTEEQAEEMVQEAVAKEREWAGATLRTFARHLENCNINNESCGFRRCSCGLNALLNSYHAKPGAKETI